MEATAKAGRVHTFTATVYENDPVEVWQIYRLLHIDNEALSGMAKVGKASSWLPAALG